MTAYSHTIEIRRPVAEVFAFVTDPARYPSWQASIVSLETDRRGPLRLGSEAWTVELSGAAARLAGPLVSRATRSELEANSERLKVLLEAAV